MGSNSFKSSFATWKEKHLTFNHPQWSFKTLSRPLLHLFGIYPELSHFPALMECPTDSVSILYWEDYLKRGPNAEPRYRKRMESIKILELLRKKERSGVKHEYFAARIDHPECGIRYIRIERSSSSATLSNPSRSSTPRVDPFVTSSKRLPRNDKTIERVVAKNISLVDIAIAAKLVRDHDERYRVLKGQCFWYSDMLMRILENHFINPDVDGSFKKLRGLGPVLEQEDVYAPNWKAETLPKEGGEVSHIPIYTLRKADVKELSEVLQKKLKDFAEKVQAAEALIQEIADLRERAKLAERLQALQEKNAALQEECAALQKESVALQKEHVAFQEENATSEEEITRPRANQQAGPSRRQ
ncbi:hypothetical protein BU17DRAFT_70297 [Hysterangium stoloniferum]|nr:hypothetical protein BU17DRAFT_70297 [Hysterangium stoloniferum]